MDFRRKTPSFNWLSQREASQPPLKRQRVSENLFPSACGPVWPPASSLLARDGKALGFGGSFLPSAYTPAPSPAARQAAAARQSPAARRAPTPRSLRPLAELAPCVAGSALQAPLSSFVKPPTLPSLPRLLPHLVGSVQPHAARQPLVRALR